MFTPYAATVYSAIPVPTRTIAHVVLSLAVLVILVALSVTDIRTRRIPNPLNLALLLCGALAIWLVPSTDVTSRIIGLLCVSAPLLLIAVVIKNSFGMGDVKLMASAGFLLGWQSCFVAFAIGTVTGGIYGALLLILRKKSRTDSFAFGPCLAIGIFAALLNALFP